MEPINVMVNGIPGKVACTVTRHVREDRRFRLIPHGRDLEDAMARLDLATAEP